MRARAIPFIRAHWLSYPTVCVWTLLLEYLKRKGVETWRRAASGKAQGMSRSPVDTELTKLIIIIKQLRASGNIWHLISLYVSCCYECNGLVRRSFSQCVWQQLSVSSVGCGFNLIHSDSDGCCEDKRDTGTLFGNPVGTIARQQNSLNILFFCK